MKASTRQQHLLLALQDLDHLIARLRRRRTQIPELSLLSGLQTEVATARDSYMRLQRELDTQKAEIDRLETDISMVRERRKRNADLIAVSTSPKEAQLLQKELESLSHRQSTLEDRELELMAQNENATESFLKAEMVLQGADARRAEVLGSVRRAESTIDTEIAHAVDDRAGLAAEIQRDILGVYEEIRTRTGVGAARLRGNVSEGSNMALAPAELANIRNSAADELIFCPQSGAILVQVEDSE